MLLHVGDDGVDHVFLAAHLEHLKVRNVDGHHDTAAREPEPFAIVAVAHVENAERHAALKAVEHVRGAPTDLTPSIAAHPPMGCRRQNYAYLDLSISTRCPARRLSGVHSQ